ncbi:radical SAM/SPASM domain-containing protein [Chloroflexota bacterium]
MVKEENVNYGALRMWTGFNPRRIALLLRLSWRHRHAIRRHRRNQHHIDGSIPSVLAVSPTMRCNYNCKGCYSRGRPTNNELSTGELDVLYSEAEELGVHSIVLTGGEPFLRSDTLDLIARHRSLLFFIITNGSLMTSDIARRIARSGNAIPLVSIEGSSADTDERRHPGAHETALRAFDHLRKAQALFGFVATNTAANTAQLATEAFIDQMVAVGCAVGFFTEYVPCGPNPNPDWVLGEATRASFRERILEFRRSKPIVLSHFPDDEYGKENRCSAAGRTSLHINSQGDIEPCPFASITRENIRHGGLIAACRSPFLRAIREQPNLLQRQRYACSLFEHHAELDGLAQQFRDRGGPKS